jgi:hypothetical protein
MNRPAFYALARREQARFAAYSARCAVVDWRVTARPYPGRRRGTVRDLAVCYTRLEVVRIVVTERLLALPRANVVGVIRHELGHAADPDTSRPGAERRADRIAAAVTGTPIRYDARDVQTTGPGVTPRPARLGH